MVVIVLLLIAPFRHFLVQLVDELNQSFAIKYVWLPCAFGLVYEHNSPVKALQKWHAAIHIVSGKRTLELTQTDHTGHIGLEECVQINRIKRSYSNFIIYKGSDDSPSIFQFAPGKL